MLYELRIYRCVPGKRGAVLDRIRSTVLPIWERYGIRPFKFWTAVTDEGGDELYYMLEWSSLAERDERLSAFRADDEWGQRRAESEADGPLILSESSTVLAEVDM